MKNQLCSLFALLLLSLAACQPPADSKEAPARDDAGFDKNVATVRSFIKAHSEENMDALMALVADTVQYSPAAYNGNVWLGKAEYMAALKGYHDNFENIQFQEGITLPDTLENGMWSGSVYPEVTATSTPNYIRVYGTWTAKHTASGKNVGVKWYALVFFNDAGKIVRFSDYFDVNGLAVQIAAE